MTRENHQLWPLSAASTTQSATQHERKTEWQERKNEEGLAKPFSFFACYYSLENKPAEVTEFPGTPVFARGV